MLRWKPFCCGKTSGQRWGCSATFPGFRDCPYPNWETSPTLRPTMCLVSHVICSGGADFANLWQSQLNSICSRAALPRKGSTPKMNLTNILTPTSTHLSLPTHPILKLTLRKADLSLLAEGKPSTKTFSLN